MYIYITNYNYITIYNCTFFSRLPQRRALPRHGRRLFDRFRAAWARGAEDGCSSAKPLTGDVTGTQWLMKHGENHREIVVFHGTLWWFSMGFYGI